mmetsp:Transcript_69124/g.202407  ORF Transcript_69124/g.202407 Transcript_69124/m.202407 type:complete len:172 (-) Transcript_69124:106-621(-)
MAPKQDEPVEQSDDDSLDGMAGLMWVPKKVLEDVTAKLEKKEDIPKKMVEQLIEVDDAADDLAMVPVDISDCTEIEDEDNLIEKLGTAKAAEIFVKGRKKFVDSLASMSEEAKSNIRQEMTGAEYKKMVEEEMADLECGESELGEDDEEEEDGSEEEDEAAEPAKKKSKTS